jgi:uncharacterized protein YceH (UPF0502 family)
MYSDPPAPEQQDAQGPASGKTAGLQLSALEARILGCLMEKERTTPEVYPLSLNGLVNACNQTSNRDPVVEYDEQIVRHGLDRLRQKKLTTEVWGAGARVHKFRHTLRDLYDFGEAEFAILCVLLLRGPQTPGELRTRTERLHAFANLEEVERSLATLMRPEDPLARVLLAGPGQKENRYLQLLSIYEEVKPAAPEKRETILVDASRLESMESEIRELKGKYETLADEFAKFRRQFE